MSEEKELFSKIGKHDFFEENFETEPAENYTEESRLIARIGFRLLTARYYIIAAGIITAVAGRNIPAILIGGCLVAGGAWMILKTKDYPTMDIYEKVLVLYTSPECKRIVRIPYEDIEQWSIENKEGQMANVKLVLKNGMTVYKPTFQLDKAAKHLASLMYEKETRIINRKEALKEKMALPGFVEKIFKKK